MSDEADRADRMAALLPAVTEALPNVDEDLLRQVLSLVMDFDDTMWTEDLRNFSAKFRRMAESNPSAAKGLTIAAHAIDGFLAG